MQHYHLTEVAVVSNIHMTTEGSLCLTEVGNMEQNVHLLRSTHDRTGATSIQFRENRGSSEHFLGTMLHGRPTFVFSMDYNRSRPGKSQPCLFHVSNFSRSRGDIKSDKLSQIGQMHVFITWITASLVIAVYSLMSGQQ